MGKPHIITGASEDALVLTVLGCSTDSQGNIHLSAKFDGSIVRDGRKIEATGVTQPIVIPAKDVT